MSHGIKKYLSKRVVPIIYTLEKSLVSCFFSDRVKNIYVIYFGMYECPLYFLEQTRYISTINVRPM